MNQAEADPTTPSAGGVVHRAWNALGTQKALVIAGFSVLAYRVWLYLAIGQYAALRGDEVFYWGSARIINHVFYLERLGDSLSFQDSVNRIISRGWFLPGMSAVMAPARLVSEEPYFGRVWAGFLSLALLLWVVRRVKQMYSRRAAVFTLLMIGIMPYTAWFAFSLWGGQIGGLIMVLNLLWTVRLGRQIRTGEQPQWRQFVLLGMSVVTSVYIRPTTLGQVIPMAAILFFAYATHDTFWPAFGKSIQRWGVMLLVFMILFSPWTIALMKKFDGPFFVATSRPLAEVIRNAPPEDLERVGTGFGAWQAEIERLMEERNEGYYAVVTAERARVTRDRSLGERLEQVSHSMRRFYDAENQFLSSALGDAAANEAYNLSDAEAKRLRARLFRFNSWAWTALTIVMIYVLMRRWSFWQSDGWLGLVLRGAMVMTLFQPLTGNPHGRHISFLVPLLVLSAGLALDNRINGSPDPIPSTRWPWVEKVSVNAFSALIGAFVIFYFIT